MGKDARKAQVLVQHACFPVMGMIGYSPEGLHCRDCKQPVTMDSQAWINWFIAQTGGN